MTVSGPGPDRSGTCHKAMLELQHRRLSHICQGRADACETLSSKRTPQGPSEICLALVVGAVPCFLAEGRQWHVRIRQFDFASGDPRLQVVEALGGLRKEVLAGGEALLGGTLLRDKAVEWGDLGVVIDGEEQRKGEALFLDRPH